jgi:hypothetical protein
VREGQGGREGGGKIFVVGIGYRVREGQGGNDGWMVGWMDGVKYWSQFREEQLGERSRNRNR